MKALYIIQRGRDLLVFDFELKDVENREEFIDICKFHFEEKVEAIKENSLMFKENYFDSESLDVYDDIDVVILNEM